MTSAVPRTGDPARSPPRPPPQVPDHELLCRIGSGSYGQVWLARNVMGRFRAVKVIYRDEFADERPFQREFAGIQRFEPISRLHESQVDILHVGWGQDCFYYVMEVADDLCRGQAIDPTDYQPRTIRSEIQRRGKLPLTECVGIALSLTTALEHLHSHSLVHRDIKPSNIIFVDGVPKLADIGLVTGTDATRSYVGTEGYIPPEGPGTSAADFYSLGKVLYELSTGKDRQDFPEPPTLAEGAPVDRDWLEFHEILLKACESDPRRRYRTAREMHTELELLRGGKSVRRVRVLERRLWLLSRVGLAVAVLLAVTSSAYLFSVNEAAQARRQAQRADQEAAHAKEAERLARERLWDAYLAQAQARRWSGRAGRRFESLEVVRKAAEIRPSVELRNEAIACLALPDLGTVREWDALPAGTRLWTFDNAYERYARGDGQGNLSVRRVADDRELVRLPGWGPPAESQLSFSPDGRLLAALYGSDSLDLRVWDLQQQRIQLQTRDIRGRCFDFSPDSRCLALAQHNGPILLYDLASGQCTRSLAQGPLPYYVVFAPDGQRLAISSTATSTVEVRSVTNGQLLESLVHSNFVRAVAWHPRGDLLATAGDDHTICLWDTRTGQRRAVLEAHQGPVITLAFSHRGDLLASSAWDSTMRLWDPRNAQLLLTEPVGNCSGFSQDDHWLSYRPDPPKLGIFQVASGVECRRLGLDSGGVGGTRSCEFSSDGRLLVSAHRDGARVWDLTTGRQMAFLAESVVLYATFGPRGQLLTSGDGGLKRWPRAGPPTEPVWGPGEPVSLAGQRAWLQDFYLCADGRTLGSIYAGKILVCDLESGQMKWHTDGDPSFYRFVLSLDGRWAAGGAFPQTLVRIWRGSDGAVVQDLPLREVNQVAFSRDSQWLVTCDLRDYRCWDTASWQCRCSVARYATGSTDGQIAFAPDSRTVAVTHSAHAVRLLETATGRQLATFETPERQLITALAFSPDGHRLVVCGQGPAIYVWDLPLIRQELAALHLDWD